MVSSENECNTAGAGLPSHPTKMADINRIIQAAQAAATKYRLACKVGRHAGTGHEFTVITIHGTPAGNDIVLYLEVNTPDVLHIGGRQTTHYELAILMLKKQFVAAGVKLTGPEDQTPPVSTRNGAAIGREGGDRANDTQEDVDAADSDYSPQPDYGLDRVAWRGVREPGVSPAGTADQQVRQDSLPLEAGLLDPKAKRAAGNQDGTGGQGARVRRPRAR